MSNNLVINGDFENNSLITTIPTEFNYASDPTGGTDDTYNVCTALDSGSLE